MKHVKLIAALVAVAALIAGCSEGCDYHKNNVSVINDSDETLELTITHSYTTNTMSVPKRTTFPANWETGDTYSVHAIPNSAYLDSLTNTAIIINKLLDCHEKYEYRGGRPETDLECLRSPDTPEEVQTLHKALADIIPKIRTLEKEALQRSPSSKCKVSVKAGFSYSVRVTSRGNGLDISCTEVDLRNP